MNKAELINSIASKTGMSKTDSKKALDAVFTSIDDALRNGERISIQGFGSFGISHRKARIGRNPRTGERLTIPAKNVVRFKPSVKADPIPLL